MQKQRLICALVASLALSIPAPGLASLSAPIVETTSGRIAGTADGAILSWKGIPFAAPPVKELRWRAPQDPASWTGVRQATQFGASCPQTLVTPTQLSPLGKTDEDCLYLNIWAPEGAPDAKRKLPVMVWLHGGGFIAGAGSERQFDGSALARHGVILVTLNYRLGRLGFFAHPALSKEQSGAPRGNYGLLDQIAALRWVQRNIAAFGGDPGNITLFGESAGGFSTLALMGSPLARGLFHKAIVESGAVRMNARDIARDTPSAPSAESMGRTWAESLGIHGDDAASLKALRALPVERVAPAAPAMAEIMAIMQTSGPMVDGQVLPATLAEIFAARRQAHIPMIVGSNSLEGDVWSFADGGYATIPIMPKTAAQILAHVPADKRTAIHAHYAAAANGNATRADGMMRSDAFLGAMTFKVAREVSQAAPVWLYRFDARPAQTRKTVPGARHGTEIFYVFRTLDRFPFKGDLADEADRNLSARMLQYWTSFARDGTRRTGGPTDWPRFDPARPAQLAFDTGRTRLEPVTHGDILNALAALAF